MKRIDFKRINVRKSHTVVLVQLSYPYNPLRLKVSRFLQRGTRSTFHLSLSRQLTYSAHMRKATCLNRKSLVTKMKIQTAAGISH